MFNIIIVLTLGERGKQCHEKTQKTFFLPFLFQIIGGQQQNIAFVVASLAYEQQKIN